MRVVGQLKPGVSLDQARAELEAIRTRLAEASPQPFLDRATLDVVPLTDRLVGDSRRALWVLLIAVSFVLLIACANIANLLLARTAARQREMAVRIAVGAGRARVVRQFLTESLVLALLGAVAGVLVSLWTVETIVGLLPHAVPRLAETTVLDARVLAFTLSAAVVTTLLVGVAPVAALGAMNPYVTLKEGAVTVSTSLKSMRLRRLLVGTEIALAVVLLTGCGAHDEKLLAYAHASAWICAGEDPHAQSDVHGAGLPRPSTTNDIRRESPRRSAQPARRLRRLESRRVGRPR